MPALAMIGDDKRQQNALSYIPRATADRNNPNTPTFHITSGFLKVKREMFCNESLSLCFDKGLCRHKYL